MQIRGCHSQWIPEEEAKTLVVGNGSRELERCRRQRASGVLLPPSLLVRMVRRPGIQSTRYRRSNRHK